MVGHVEAGLLAHRLYFTDKLPDDALFNKLGGQRRIERDGDAAVAYGVEALFLLCLDEQVFGGKNNLTRRQL